MKRLLLIILLVLLFQYGQSQNLRLADAKTTETILEKHEKALFAHNYNYGSLKNAVIQDDYGFGFPSTTAIIPAMGDWYLRPDCQVYETNLPAFDKGYKIYKLLIPYSTARNDSISKYSQCISQNFSKIEDIYNPMCIDVYVGYNAKKNDIKYVPYMSRYGSYPFPLYDLAQTNRLRKYMEKYKLKGSVQTLKPDTTYYFPKTENQKRAFVESELLKNIYIYRFAQTGILDSLIVSNTSSLKQGKDLFPFLDKLLPDMKAKLCLTSQRVYPIGIPRNNHLEYWRFFYPGADFIKENGVFRRDSTWQKYIKLKPQYYVVAYDTLLHTIHFVSGEGIYLSEYVKEYIPIDYQQRWGRDGKDWFVSKQAKADFAKARKMYVSDRMFAYDRSLRGYDVIPAGEDENYWYFTLNASEIATSLHNVLHVDDNNKALEISSSQIGFTYSSIKYKIRMSKDNLEKVEIIDKTTMSKHDSMEDNPWEVKTK